MSDPVASDMSRQAVDARVDARVLDLYTRYPYPPADAETGVPLFGLLDYVRYVLWPGRASLDGLRVLDAGCGTGQVAVHIARTHPEVRVVAIDISSASLELARKRAQSAGVNDDARLTFKQASIEDLASEEQPFDYVISSGVLHHLADPVAGTRRLTRLLAPGGGIGIMVYAPHGRHGVYVLQEALRRLVGASDLAEQVVVARQLLAGLPAGHPFRPAQFADQDWADDAGLVDLLLHVRDRSYSVPELIELLGQSGLRLERFFSPLAYRPENHTSDSTLKARVATLDQEQGAAMAELLCGVMPMHAVFATHTAHRPVRLTATDLTVMLVRPTLSPLFRWDDLFASLAAAADKAPRSGPQRREVRKDPRSFTLAERQTGVLTRSFEVDRWIVEILRRCDGRKTTQEILQDDGAVVKAPGSTIEDKRVRARQLIQFFGQQEILLFDM